MTPDISTQERESQLREMERTVMEKVSMTNVAGKPSRTERHPSPAGSSKWLIPASDVEALMRPEEK